LVKVGGKAEDNVGWSGLAREVLDHLRHFTPSSVLFSDSQKGDKGSEISKWTLKGMGRIKG